MTVSRRPYPPSVRLKLEGRSAGALFLWPGPVSPISNSVQEFLSDISAIALVVAMMCF